MKSCCYISWAMLRGQKKRRAWNVLSTMLVKGSAPVRTTVTKPRASWVRPRQRAKYSSTPVAERPAGVGASMFRRPMMTWGQTMRGIAWIMCQPSVASE